MSGSSWAVFSLSQATSIAVAILLVVGLREFVGFTWGPTETQALLILVLPSIGLILLDLFLITGVVGPGWPMPNGESAALLILGAGIILSCFVFEMRAPDIWSYGIGLAGIGICVTLLLFATHSHMVALPAADGIATAPTPSSDAVAQPTAAATSGPDWILIWTAVGGIGSFMGGCAALIAISKRAARRSS
jgi:hypothetical protein